MPVYISFSFFGIWMKWYLDENMIMKIIGIFQRNCQFSVKCSIKENLIWKLCCIVLIVILILCIESDLKYCICFSCCFYLLVIVCISS